MTLLVLILVAVLSYLALFKLPQRLRLLQKLTAFNGPPALPLLGNTLDFSKVRTDVINVFQRFIDTYGYRYKVWLGIQPYVVVANASDIEKILSSQSQIEKSSDYDFLHRWLGLGLLTSGGEKWFRRRKQLTPAFHFKILDDFLRVFNEQCSILRNVLERKGSQKIDVFPMITHCALDIICETAMGRKINAQEKSSSSIKEGLRIYPSVPFIGRKLTKDLELDDKAVIPVGCTVFVHTYFLHRDPKVFPDPETLTRIDSFRKMHGADIHLLTCRLAQVRLVTGPRNCIGQKFALMEEKVMVSTIFRNFRVKAAMKRKDVDVLCELITRPEDGLYVTLEKR